MRSFRRRLCIALALWSAVITCHAQQVYKHVLPDGRIIYSDQPEQAGAAKSKAVEVPPPPSESDMKKALQRKQAETSKRQEVDARLKARRDRLEAADRNVEAARKALAEAEANLERGRESQPGDRAGNVGPTTRLNDRYWERQAENERAVAEARKTLDEAQRTRNELR